eukprot:CAMPEP_0175023094 /NCGR_PEP_ID=MMETSP0005-20121125/15671_1 /TAXON_ID=420556 /ORGANISM="Ochromonas sp., Strain CCMP1393" /LENGTH=477 /DNA_ID=CAMNT_0016281399 /DNA_START=39 /DNA_END=1472 /DNA_ORIENTATION=+
MYATFCLLLLSVVTLSSYALQELPERARGGRAYKEFLQKHNDKISQLKTATAQTWNAQVDNFDATNNATFEQRYYLDDQYWLKGGKKGPVFFLISGEGTLSGPPGGYVATLGEEYSALLVTLEHRFYGESIPEGNAFTSNYNKHLNVEQALGDLSGFTNYVKQRLAPESRSVPWVIFGGSYSGGLSSWYRAAYPQQSVAALSSSGVVNCIVDFYQFDMQVSAAAGNKCGDKIKRVQEAFRNTISDGGEEGLQKALSKFHCEKDMSVRDFYFMIADSWSMTIQYSAKSQICAALDGISSSSTDEEVMDTFAAFSNDFWGDDFCSMGFYNTKALADPARWDVNSRSWRFQTCSQVSYFNTAPTSGSLRSYSLDLEYHLEQCAAIFGQKMFPTSPQFNQHFGGEFPRAKNVFYSNFADDPWQRAGVWFAPSTDQPYHLAECDDCGHCLDLHTPDAQTDPAQLQESRAQFEYYLADWLQQE